jgi:hypothetical protein
VIFFYEQIVVFLFLSYFYKLFAENQINLSTFK